MNSVLRMRRPWPVTLLAVGVFLFAALQAAALWQIWTQRALLASLPLTLPLSLWIAQGLVWTAAGLSACAGLWAMRRWAMWLTGLGAPLFALTWAIERWLGSAASDSRLSLPFAIGAHGIAVVVVEVILWTPGLFRRLARS